VVIRALKRFAQVLVVVLGVTGIVTALSQLLPGGPARALLGPRASDAAIDAFNVANGFDRPPPVQYLYWLQKIVTGDFGRSLVLSEPVTDLLADRLVKTAILVGVSLVLAFVIAVPIALAQAARRGRVSDQLVTGGAFVFYSMPMFWLALLLVSFFAIQLPLFPAQAPQGPAADVLSQPAGFVLPVLCLTLVTVAAFSRYIRAAAIETLRQDWIRTARAKGASTWRIMRKHVLRNSLLPTITLVGVMLPWCVSGALVVEVVFNYPGMGLLFWSSAQSQDFPVLLGATVVVAVITALGSLLADLLYAVADPRIRTR
jgi:peptide/nickel transport system permease protein